MQPIMVAEKKLRPGRVKHWHHRTHRPEIMPTLLSTSQEYIFTVIQDQGSRLYCQHHKNTSTRWSRTREVDFTVNITEYIYKVIQDQGSRLYCQHHKNTSTRWSRTREVDFTVNITRIHLHSDSGPGKSTLLLTSQEYFYTVIREDDFSLTSQEYFYRVIQDQRRGLKFQRHINTSTRWSSNSEDGFSPNITRIHLQGDPGPGKTTYNFNTSRIKP